MLLILTASFGQPLDRFLARRDYEIAVEHYRAQIDSGHAGAAATRDLARVYEHWHRFDSSLAWWNQALTSEPTNDSARLGRWRVLHRQAETDSGRLSRVRLDIMQEVAELAGTSPESGPAVLALAHEGYRLSNPMLAQATGLLLVDRFPDSPAAHRFVGEVFYDSLYPVWHNDTTKVALLRRFLVRFPRTEWRSTGYMYLLGALLGLGDTAALRLTAREMVENDSSSPFCWRYAAAILNRAGIEPTTAAAYARKAVKLEPSAAKPPNKPDAQWELERPVLFGSARLALAEALVALDSLEAARLLLQEAIAHSDYGPDLEATVGPHQALLGETEARLGDTAAAVSALLQSLIVGDVRNKSTPRAESLLADIWGLSGDLLATRAREHTGYRGPQFTDVTHEIGLADVRGSRVAWGDFDDDGYDDLLVSGSRLFRNDSGQGFTDVSEDVGLGAAKGRGGVWADYDNDGRLDFYMCGSDSVDRLWRNLGGRFEDVTESSGYPSNPGPTEGAAWADFDNDGFVDLYCANYENWAGQTYWSDRLYHNAAGSFQDETRLRGTVPPRGVDRAGRGVAWADYDDDGWPDCFVANYRLQENFLWHNDAGDRFRNTAPATGVAGDEVDGWFGHTIGACWGDYDNDGDLDLFTADLAHPRYIEFSNRSRLYENLGPSAEPRFVDRRAAAGIKYEETHSNPAWADVDNDGDLDLYITSIYEGRRSFLYENLGRAPGDSCVRFRDVTWPSGTRCFNGWGCAFADYDGDGDLDLAVGSGSGVRLLRNECHQANGWLQVRVLGTLANRCGIGARVTVTRGEHRWIREVAGGSGTTSQSSLTQHFGLGPSAGVLELEVRFSPDRAVSLRNVAPNQLVRVEEPER